MTIEMASDELVNFLLGSGVQVLELVHRLELYYIEAIWKNTIRFAFQ